MPHAEAPVDGSQGGVLLRELAVEGQTDLVANTCLALHLVALAHDLKADRGRGGR